MDLKSIGVLTFLGLVGAGCVIAPSGEMMCAVGTQQCSCTPGGGCDPGLVCVDQVCSLSDGETSGAETESSAEEGSAEAGSSGGESESGSGPTTSAEESSTGATVDCGSWINQPGTELCWSGLCGGETWNSDACIETEDGAQPWALSNSRCPEGSRLPTLDEALSLLSNCNMEAPDDYQCASCLDSSPCGEMYAGVDFTRTVNMWTSTPCTLPEPLTGEAYWAAYLNEGQVLCAGAVWAAAWETCVQPGS